MNIAKNLSLLSVVWQHFITLESLLIQCTDKLFFVNNASRIHQFSVFEVSVLFHISSILNQISKKYPKIERCSDLSEIYTKILLECSCVIFHF